ncbi:MAG: integrase [Candidatus Deianiraeaceae bacterium]|jgi:integrase
MFAFGGCINFQDFSKFKKDWSVDFKRHLVTKKEDISMSYCNNYMSHVRVFFEWLVKQKGYTHIHNKGITLLYLTQNERNEAKATGIQKSYLVHKILATIRNMPNDTPIQMRDKAIISLCILTTPRITALMSARMMSVDFLEEYNAWAFMQRKTKKRRAITAFFIGQYCESIQDIIQNVIKWKEYLVKKGFTDKDYLFPKIVPSFDKDGVHILELKKQKIKSSTTAGDIFNKAFINNNLAKINPHSFRHTISKLMKRQQQSARLVPAFHENYGHTKGLAQVLSTYGQDYLCEQAELLSNFPLE